jgi:hypothetical protein
MRPNPQKYRKSPLLKDLHEERRQGRIRRTKVWGGKVTPKQERRLTRQDLRGLKD